MRRKPQDIPQLKPHDEAEQDNLPHRKKRGVIPHQDRFSVQNIKDLTTPRGISMLNEELRRLRPDKPYEEEPEQLPSGGGAGGGGVRRPDTQPDGGDGGGDGGPKWALTVKHNDVIRGVPKEIQGLNFKDRRIINTVLMPIVFDLKAQALEQALIEGIESGENREIAIRGYAQLPIISGKISINKLPSSIEDTPNERDKWKRQGRHYKPENGYYGWAVYNYIDHGWTLENVNDFILNLVDLHEVFVRDGLTELELQEVLDFVTANSITGTEEEQRAWIEEYFRLRNDEIDTDGIYPPIKNFEPQVFYPEIEGKRIKELTLNNLEIEKDVVILRGIYKPNLYNYFGGGLPTRTMDLVEGNTVRSNIVYYYTLMRK